MQSCDQERNIEVKGEDKFPPKNVKREEETDGLIEFIQLPPLLLWN